MHTKKGRDIQEALIQSWVSSMFSKKKVMKWQKGSKQHSHIGYGGKYRGTKLCTRAQESISLEKSMLERAEAEQRNPKLIPRQ